MKARLCGIDDLSEWDRVRADLLVREIRATGSIKDAAKALGIAYRTALDLYHEWGLADVVPTKPGQGTGGRPRPRNAGGRFC